MILVRKTADNLGKSFLWGSTVALIVLLSGCAAHEEVGDRNLSDAIVIPGPMGERCSIVSIVRLDDAELDLILPSDERDSAVPVSAADIGATQTWGNASNVVSDKHLYFSEQPDTAALIEARNQAVGVVVNDHGMKVDPSIALAEKAGLTKPIIEARVRQYLNETDLSAPESK